MTKEEYLEAKEKSAKYQTLEHEFNRIDDLLKKFDHYNGFTVETKTTAPNVYIAMNSQIRDGLVSVIQAYKDSIAEQMEAL